MSETKIITLDELKEHTKKDNLYVLLHGKVYSVSKFIDEHPGGDEVILAEAGKDATEAFEDVGHSDEAREILQTLYIGDFEKGAALPTKTERTSTAAPAAQAASSVSYFLPLAALAAYFAWRFYSS
ncbi:cytochrome b5 [Fomitiporia mediterranea MF3/22]|uniref:cytochrome b5 n=1 Tax=Fomitiporia mediterranea (strain MF3/22) TaxID=694068 RepID=UPI0004407DD0|nr:cytochrome b5 [Fomitiporia mediterranea MF3/22]EJD00950.1 cytochrome b5 [Fomitiporia mediterranea MF3/22]